MKLHGPSGLMAHQALPRLYGLGLGLGDGCGLAESFEGVSSTYAPRLGQLELVASCNLKLS